MVKISEVHRPAAAESAGFSPFEFSLDARGNAIAPPASGRSSALVSRPGARGVTGPNSLVQRAAGPCCACLSSRFRGKEHPGAGSGTLSHLFAFSPLRRRGCRRPPRVQSARPTWR